MWGNHGGLRFPRFFTVSGGPLLHGAPHIFDRVEVWRASGGQLPVATINTSQADSKTLLAYLLPAAYSTSSSESSGVHRRLSQFLPQLPPFLLQTHTSYQL